MIKKRKNKIIIPIICIILMVILIFGIKYYLENCYIAEVEFVAGLHQNDDPEFYGNQIVRLIKKNQDWSDIPLSKKFREKYNSKDGILGNINVTDAYLSDNEYVLMSYSGPYYNIMVCDGLKKDLYYTKIINSTEPEILEDGTRFWGYDDIEILDIIHKTDEGGRKVNGMGRKFVKDTAYGLLYNMIFAYDGEAGLTEHFKQKYPNFDGFFDRQGIELQHARFDGKMVQKFQLKRDGNFDFDNRVYKDITILDVYRSLICHYDLYFYIDNEGYLDGYKMVLVSEENDDGSGDHYRDAPTYATNISILAGKNRDWTGLPITQKFREKYNSKDGIFGKLDVDYLEFLCNTAGLIKYPVKAYFKDKTCMYFGLEFIMSSTHTVDDIIIKKIDVDTTKNYTFEELMDMF